MLYQRSPELWYLRYCADEQLPRTAQTKPASVGSAFDALIKSRLYRHYYHEVAVDHPYSARTLLAQQVEPQNRDWATAAAVHCLQQYEYSGAAADLLMTTLEPPEFEFKLKQVVTLDGVDVPIYGIPDMSFIYGGYRVILDWKVMGFCAKSQTSPQPGYLICRDGWNLAFRMPSRTHRQMHSAARRSRLGDMTISSQPFELSNPEWATQLTTYSWLLGEPVGSTNFIAAVEQLCGNPANNGSDFPDLRIASFRGQISSGFQETVIGQYSQCWVAYKSGHIFLTESRAASDDHCAFLDNLVKVLMKGDPNSSKFLAATEFLKGKDVYDATRDYRRDIIVARRLRGEVGLPDPDDYSGVESAAATRPGLIDLTKVSGNNSNDSA